ncbi:hypothetical protein [Nocardia sp. NPDC004604]|uniref:hypothetical protein n=1 Tax=Nocardia sp. NPDC004604 TaxID=3157013 RepID=UPI0033BAFCF6
MRAKPAAIGYLRTDISGISQTWDEIQIRSLAKRYGYDLAKTVAFSAQTDHPLSRLLNVVRRLDVDAVITPNLEHLGGAVPPDLVRVCEINTISPKATYAPHAPFRFVDVDGA